MSTRIDIDVSGLNGMKALANPAQFRKAVQAGLRYASPSVKKTAAKEIGAKYALSAARIKKDIKDPKYTSDSILVTFNRVPPSLRAYGGKPIRSRTTAAGIGTPIGVKYRIFRGQTEKRDNVFWLQLGSVPFPGIPFRRDGPGSAGLVALYGPSIGSIFTGDSKFGEALRKATTEAAQVQFVKGVERYQSRIARGY
jgi:hypothetical protein